MREMVRKVDIVQAISHLLGRSMEDPSFDSTSQLLLFTYETHPL